MCMFLKDRVWFYRTNRADRNNSPSGLVKRWKNLKNPNDRYGKPWHFGALHIWDSSTAYLVLLETTNFHFFYMALSSSPWSRLASTEDEIRPKSNGSESLLVFQQPIPLPPMTHSPQSPLPRNIEEGFSTKRNRKIRRVLPWGGFNIYTCLTSWDCWDRFCDRFCDRMCDRMCDRKYFWAGLSHSTSRPHLVSKKYC